MKLTLNMGDLKLQYQGNKLGEEKVSFEMLDDKAQEAVRLVGSSAYVSYDGKIQVAVYPPRND